MKDFSYYSTTATTPAAYETFLASYNNTHMTALDEEELTRGEYGRRLAALAADIKELRRKYAEAYRDARAVLKQEFWQDARVALGYGDLPSSVISALESEAWDRGHSHGYSEVFNELRSVVEFVRKVRADL